MRLHELRGYKNSEEIDKFKRDTTNIESIPSFGDRKTILKHFLNYLQMKGYTPLSNGAWSAVFTHPNINYAVKVFKSDAAYMHFYNYAINHQSNKYLPKFRGKLMQIDSTYFAVRMELLHPIISELEEDITFVLNRIAHDDGDIHDIIEQEAHDSVAMRRYFEKNMGIVETIVALRDNKGFFSPDLHKGNFMVRDDGTIVIIDPYMLKLPRRTHIPQSTGSDRTDY